MTADNRSTIALHNLASEAGALEVALTCMTITRKLAADGKNILGDSVAVVLAQLDANGEPSGDGTLFWYSAVGETSTELSGNVRKIAHDNRGTAVIIFGAERWAHRGDEHAPAIEIATLIMETPAFGGTRTWFAPISRDGDRITVGEFVESGTSASGDLTGLLPTADTEDLEPSPRTFVFLLVMLVLLAGLALTPEGIRAARAMRLEEATLAFDERWYVPQPHESRWRRICKGQHQICWRADATSSWNCNRGMCFDNDPLPIE